MRVWLRPALAAFLLLPSLVVAQSTEPVALDAEALKTYREFRAWHRRNATPEERMAAATDPEFLKKALDRWEKELVDRGGKPEDVSRQLSPLRQVPLGRFEIELWNVALTAPAGTEQFNRQPNAFLAEMVKGRKPGRALDVGMGQGRNAVFLAQLGWDVTGFDPAERAVAAAVADARRLGVADRLRPLVLGEEKFDWGKDQWDLVLLCYVGARQYGKPLVESLRPGGLLIVEAFKADSSRPTGGLVTFRDNELFQLFAADLRILRYEEVSVIPDFGPRDREAQVVRLMATKR